MIFYDFYDIFDVFMIFKHLKSFKNVKFHVDSEKLIYFNVLIDSYIEISIFYVLKIKFYWFLLILWFFHWFSWFRKNKHHARTSAGGRQVGKKQARAQVRGHTRRYAC